MGKEKGKREFASLHLHSHLPEAQINFPTAAG